MKIALCLSGQARSYRKAHEYINKNLLEPYSVDVFAHTWKPEDNMRRLSIFDGINELYSPLSFVYDHTLNKAVNSDLFVPNSSHPANFCTSMFYSIYKANDLRIRHELSRNINYDFVVRSRFDIALNKLIDFNALEKNKLYTSKDSDGEHALLNDQFAIADPDTMNVYASTYLFLRKLHASGVPLCGHAMLQANLEKFGIEVVRIDIDHPFVDGRFNRGRHSIIREDMDQWVDTKIWGY